MSTMSFDNLETAYEVLAKAIDQAGEAGEARFFTRLALLLAHEVGEIESFRQAVEAALEGMAASSQQ
jgi:hypothetical protein